jgi:pilus assembly protein Flp/PilA
LRPLDADLVFTISLKRSTHNLQLSTCWAADYPIFLNDESAATSIEYGVIAAGIAPAIITVTKGLGSKLNTTFTSVQTALK